MKKYLWILAGLLLMCFTNFKLHQNKYLPVFITLENSGISQSELMLYLKASFGTRKIKTLSKRDADAYIKAEGAALAEEYLKMGGDVKDFEKFKNFMSANMRKIGNSLTIDLAIDKNGFINDTIRWGSFSIPIDFLNPPKTKWHYMILDSSNAKTMLQMSQSIVDSIIASNVLVKE